MATKDEAIAHGYRLLAKPVLALRQAGEILRQYPSDSGALRLMGAARRRTGDIKGAIEAERQSIAASKFDTQLIEAANAMLAEQIGEAERMLKARLKRDPLDVVAIRMLATLAQRIGRLEDSQSLLERALQIMPSYVEAKSNLANIYYQRNLHEEALGLLNELDAADALTSARRNLRASTLGKVGRYEQAIEDYLISLKENRDHPGLWMSLGHLYKTVGNQDASVDAYRRSIALRPEGGESWWSLANLKIVRFTEDDAKAMEAALDADGITPEDKLQLHFALGKYYEDHKDAESSWTNYAAGNRIRLSLTPHSDVQETRLIERSIKLFTRKYFADRHGQGDPAPDPIFIVGMPRAGSTLLEQILSSHSQVEGTMELGEIIGIARRIGERKARDEKDNYPVNIAKADAQALRDYGAEFIERTRIHRILGTPFFIDKMPNNWQHVGLIRLILPNAKIIDARRDPLDCGFSNFKQHFARGQTFAYDLTDFGHYYRDYVKLMAHMDKVQPGAIHRVIHEQLLDDPETIVRGMLAYCGLEFEEGCMRFYENKRAVRTASAEQVRQPLSKKGVGQYKPFEQWLDPLKQALGPALDQWDDAQRP